MMWLFFGHFSAVEQVVKLDRKIKPTLKCQKLQFLKWPLDTCSKSESVPIKPHINIYNFTAEMRVFMFTAWYKKKF